MGEVTLEKLKAKIVENGIVAEQAITDIIPSDGSEVTQAKILTKEGFIFVITAKTSEYAGKSGSCNVTVESAFKPEKLMIGSAIHTENYGKEVVGYSAGGISKWRLFYQDDDYTYIISDELVPGSLESSIGEYVNRRYGK